MMRMIFPKLFDLVMQPIESLKFHQIRRNLISKSKGRVLEIGSGTGANFLYYKKGVFVDAIEANPLMIEQSKTKKHSALVPITIHEVNAETLPFDDQIFDSVVATLVFCTIDNPLTALAEIQRVTKSGAPILFFEHVRMEQLALASIQDALTPLWKKVGDGCRLNRNTLRLIEQSGLSVTRVHSYYKGLFLVIECENP